MILRVMRMNKEKKDEATPLKKIQDFSQNIKKTLENLSLKNPKQLLSNLYKPKNKNTQREQTNNNQKSLSKSTSTGIVVVQRPPSNAPPDTFRIILRKPFK